MHIPPRASLIVLICLATGCAKAKFSTYERAQPTSNPTTQSTSRFRAQPALVAYKDQFIASNPSNSADILLVLDNSGSMKQDLMKLAHKLDGFLAVLDEGGIDWQICYTLTDISRSSTAGVARHWNTGVTVLKPSTPNRGEIFATTLSNLPRGGSADEQAIASIKLAVNRNPECFRPDATLTTIIVSDEDERSCGGRCKHAKTSENPKGKQHWAPVKYYEQYQPLTADNDPDQVAAFIQERLRGIYSRKTYINHSIVIREGDYDCFDQQDQESQAFFGIVYTHLQKITGGILGDICAPSFADQLKSMGRQTVETAHSFPLKCKPHSAPFVSLQPAVNPQPKATYSGNKLKLSPAIPVGTEVTLNYECLESSHEAMGFMPNDDN